MGMARGVVKGWLDWCGGVYPAYVYYLALLPVMVQWGKQVRPLDVILGFRIVAHDSNWVGNGLCYKRNIRRTSEFGSSDAVIRISVIFGRPLPCSEEDTFDMSRNVTCYSRIIVQSGTKQRDQVPLYDDLDAGTCPKHLATHPT
jgi:hypothetical protein